MVKAAFLFPGQGSQAVGMGKDLPPALFDRANEVLGRDLKKIIMEGPEELLKDTANTQPALYVMGMAAYGQVKAWGVEPAFLAGHSLGEYCALAAAGVFSFEDGLALVQARADAMSEAGKASAGAMAAVLGLEDGKVAAACQASCQGAEIVQPANYNSPGQVVISGHAPAVARASEACKAAGALKVVPLAVSGAFHSALMKPAGEKLRAAFPKASWSSPRIPVLANVDALPKAGPAEIQESLVAQLSGSVMWTQSMRYLLSQGVDRFLEIGSGKVLAGLMKKIDKAAPAMSVGDLESLSKGEAWLKN